MRKTPCSSFPVHGNHHPTSHRVVACTAKPLLPWLHLCVFGLSFRPRYWEVCEGRTKVKVVATAYPPNTTGNFLHNPQEKRLDTKNHEIIHPKKTKKTGGMKVGSYPSPSTKNTPLMTNQHEFGVPIMGNHPIRSHPIYRMYDTHNKLTTGVWTSTSTPRSSGAPDWPPSWLVSALR